MIINGQTKTLEMNTAGKIYAIFFRINRNIRIRINCNLFIYTCLMGVILSCNDNNRMQPEQVDFIWNFYSGTEGWTGDFTDYAVGGEEDCDFSFGHDTLPEPLDQEQGALRLAGYSYNSDLFMFIKKKITDLQPNTIYYSTITVQFASASPGTESEPAVQQGSGIFVGAGAVPIEPHKIVEENDYYGLNIGKYNQNQNGEDMVVLGSLVDETLKSEFSLKTISNENPFHCVSDENGEIWIIVAVDSAVETSTTVYFNQIEASFF